MNSPFFSIIVPVYNVGKYISKCLDSILSQEFYDFELIIVNDGSIDTTQEICDEYVKKYNNCFLHNIKNGGVSLARNFGLKAAKGNYVWFVDGDDWIEPNSLSILNKALENENLEMLGFYENRFLENQNQFIKSNSLQNISKTDGNNYLKLSQRFVSPLWVYIYNKRFIVEHGISFIDILFNRFSETLLRINELFLTL